ncbi:MAG: efflux RND transporter permease subunit [Alphaproteobacteria bacterium]|nr:efflux RND transporter permease subunit [Alphaproteobacteria bacterium]
MKIVDYVLSHKPLFWLLMLVIVLMGLLAFDEMGKLETPTFKIKKAIVVSQYPGATASQVETEVTDKIEEEIQKMSQIDNITSISRRGLSLIYVEILPSYTAAEIPQIWDELRRKVSDIRPSLPEGVSSVSVRDDFGDVYGIFLTLSGRGYSLDELKDYADLLKKEFLGIPDVAKVDFWGEQTKVIYVEFNRAKLSNLNITQEQLFATLGTSNAMADAGAVQIDDEYSRFRVTGAIDGVEEIRNLYVSDKKGQLFRIGDIAEVKRGHLEPANQIMYHNGEPAIGIGISITDSGNVVRLGENVRARLKALEATKPVGMEIGSVNFQADDVKRSIYNFIKNLIESVLIVIAILLITMGVRSGLIIGGMLILIILGTFIFMWMFGMELQLVSLGALIIALGMLVDNAIVIVDGYLVKIAKKIRPDQALKDVVSETLWPLLGATLVAILAFAAVGLNTGNVGEYCRSLFYVIGISLALSWIMAITFTPLLCLKFIRPTQSDNDSEEVYNGRIYRWYKLLLDKVLLRRGLSCIILGVCMILSVLAFSQIPRSFFPDATKNKFYIDYWRTSGSHINETQQDVQEIAKYVATLPGVTDVTTFVGEGALRFILSYDYNTPTSDYGQIVIQTDDFRKISKMIPQIKEYVKEKYPSSDARVSRFSDAIDIPFTLEVRFRGPDAKVLRQLADQAKQILRDTNNAEYIRDNWRQSVKNIQVGYSEIKTRGLGITRQGLAESLKWNFNGIACGVLRENNELIPIISRPVESERTNVNELSNVRVFSSTTGKNYALGEAIDTLDVGWEESQIYHRDRMPTITVQANPKTGTASDLQKKIRKKINKIQLPPLYSVAWGGEYENSQKAQAGLKSLFPICIMLMFLVTCFLFKTLREPLIAFIVLPFAMTGIAIGLFLLNLPFGFMAILGFLGLTGMMLKNSIVLLDQINLERQAGVPVKQALLNASISRLRPVTMAAGTTILGVMPLLTDVFFASMAATIMFGLLAATALTLLVVPLAYAILFKVK